MRNLYRTIFGVALISALAAPLTAQAQRPGDRPDQWERYDRDPYQRLAQLEPGTFINVRTSTAIDANRRDGRVFTAVVDADVWDNYRRLAVPAIPRGSRVELLVRSAPDGDLILDLESVTVRGQRYAISTTANRIDAGGRSNGGGGIIGAIIGGQDRDRWQGRAIRLPAGAVMTFRLDRELALGVRDNGYSRDRNHYHRDR